MIASSTERSSSVSRPSISSLTWRPHVRARSRTTRGILLHTVSTGCMRVFMTCSCSSLVTRLSRCALRASEESFALSSPLSLPSALAAALRVAEP